MTAWNELCSEWKPKFNHSGLFSCFRLPFGFISLSSAAKAVLITNSTFDNGRTSSDKGFNSVDSLCPLAHDKLDKHHVVLPNKNSFSVQ